MQIDDIVARSRGFISRAQARHLQDLDATLIETAFDPTRYDPVLFEVLGIDAPPRLHRMVFKRQSDFLAGRVAAARAMDDLGLPPGQVSVGDDRAPGWPEGMRGSISHTNGRSVCLATRDPTQLCGIDLEVVATGSALEAIASMCLSDNERQLVHHGLNLPPDVSATLLFSAKETIFKALYPRVGHYFGFECAEALEQPKDHLVSFRLMKTLHPRLPNGFEIAVSYEIKDDHILTYLMLPDP